MGTATLEHLGHLDTRTDEAVARLLDATVSCLARYGVAKTTIDDVAREAGYSRATVYRYFTNRTALIDAAVAREVEELLAAVTAAGLAADDLEEMVTAMYLTAARIVIGHPALQRALTDEPETILPALSFDGGDVLFAVAAARFAPVFARFLPAHRAPYAAEWCTRVLLAYLHPDRAPIPLTERRAARTLVRRHVLPALVPESPFPPSPVLAGDPVPTDPTEVTS